MRIDTSAEHLLNLHFAWTLCIIPKGEEIHDSNLGRINSAPSNSSSQNGVIFASNLSYPKISNSRS